MVFCSRCLAKKIRVGKNSVGLRSCLALVSNATSVAAVAATEEVCLNPRRRRKDCAEEEDICGFSLACAASLHRQADMLFTRRYSCFLRNSQSRPLSSSSSKPLSDCRRCLEANGINESANATCFVAGNRFQCIPVTLATNGDDGDHCSKLLCPVGMRRVSHLQYIRCCCRIRI